MPTTQTPTIRAFLDAAAAAYSRESSAPWWRGQADANWPVIPGAFRFNRTLRDEQNRCARFRSTARARRTDCPGDQDFSGWLMLMQHYGLYTRLLDWTSQPLAALLFAVNQEPERDGLVCAINPIAVNQAQGMRGMPDPNHTEIRKLILRPFVDSVGPHSEAIIALAPTHIDARMLMQGAAFTIHDSSVPLATHPTVGSLVSQFVIPAASKKSFKDYLDFLGINRAALFPDLDALAKDLNEMSFSATPDNDVPLVT